MPAKKQPANWLCNVCARIPWLELQPEDVVATLHHKSRKDLEASSQSCNLCRLILRAAISHYQDSRGVRNGVGYWETVYAVRLMDEAGTRDVHYTKQLGSCCPPRKQDYDRRTGVTAPTGKFDANLEHLPAPDAMPRLEALAIENETDCLPVWLYGNWWAASEPKEVGDVSPLRLMGIGARFGKTGNQLDAFNTQPGRANICGSPLGICTTEDSSFAKRIPGRVREVESGSDIAFGRIRSWLDNCILNHGSFCNAPALNPILPTRVLDVSMSDRQVALMQSNGIRGRYVALSHSWGSSRRITATKETREDLEEGIAVSFLPKTFRDAIEVTRRLELKYLWIDCLCIMQDDPADWEREAAAMGQVYSNAYVTVSAAASEDSYTGCFPKRENSAYISPGTKSLGYKTLRDSTGSDALVLNFCSVEPGGPMTPIHIFEEWLPGSVSNALQQTYIGTFGKRYDPIADQPLNSRGWTLQERVLSPRIIHYAKDQMYFECSSCMLSEDGFHFPDISFSLERILTTQWIRPEDHGMRKQTGRSFTVGQHAVSTGVRWEGGWIALVQEFSRRKLTFEEDKLPALAGLARVIAEDTGDIYLAGLWGGRRGHFMEDLCWRVYVQEEPSLNLKPLIKGEVLGTAIRPDEYRAPSWSWASLDAPIKFLPLSYENLVANVEDFHIEPLGTDEFGRVKSGWVDLRGPIYEIKPYEPPDSWDRFGIPVIIDLGDERGISTGAIHLDMPDEPLTFPCYALFLDPAYALIIKGKVAQGSLGSKALPSKTILTTTDVNRRKHEMPTSNVTVWIHGDQSSKDPTKRAPKPEVVTPEEYRALRDMGDSDGLSLLHKSDIDAVRIGLGQFVKQAGDPFAKKPPPINYDRERDGPLTFDKILSVAGDESWGPVTRDDPIVWVTVY